MSINSITGHFLVLIFIFLWLFVFLSLRYAVLKLILCTMYVLGFLVLPILCFLLHVVFFFVFHIIFVSLGFFSAKFHFFPFGCGVLGLRVELVGQSNYSFEKSHACHTCLFVQSGLPYYVYLSTSRLLTVSCEKDNGAKHATLVTIVRYSMLQ